jgi:hypothetical protein
MSTSVARVSMDNADGECWLVQWKAEVSDAFDLRVPSVTHLVVKFSLHPSKVIVACSHLHFALQPRSWRRYSRYHQLLQLTWLLAVTLTVIDSFIHQMDSSFLFTKCGALVALRRERCQDKTAVRGLWLY